MPAKAPIYLKNSYNTKGKRLREILNSEMISPPLGDFRHMAHVGRGGQEDMFGDTTFLSMTSSNNSELGSTASSERSLDSDKMISGGGTLRRGGKHFWRSSKKESRGRNHSTPDADDVDTSHVRRSDGYSEADSPIMQSAFSLPLLSKQSPQSSPTSSNSVGSANNNYATSTPNNKSAPASPPRLTIHTHQVRCPSPSDNLSIYEGWDLNLDLGASLLDDVMGVMDTVEL